MAKQDLEQRMWTLEYFHTLQALPGIWTIIRVDGHGFSRLTASRFAKPFNEKFRDLMVISAQALIEELHGIYSYTGSDEIWVLFHPDGIFSIARSKSSYRFQLVLLVRHLPML
jgi:tRNA(His) guanylyltransferase